MAKRRKRTTVRRKRTTARRRRTSANPTVYDAAGKTFGKFKRSAAKIVARAIGGTVGAPKRNPARRLPIGKMVTVKVRRRADGRIDVFKASR